MTTVNPAISNEYSPCARLIRRAGVQNHLFEESHDATRAEYDDAVEAGFAVPTKAGLTQGELCRRDTAED
ncbi:hypothetical protein D3C75_974120 [compost metagenome]